MARIEQYLAEAPAFSQRHARPWVTLSFAQSLDGSLAAVPGQSTTLSGEGTRRLTHQVRAAHQAILVGVGTVLADDPVLNVRFAEGESPQPIVLDSNLRTPISSRLLQREDKKPWIVCAENADQERWTALEQAGAKVLPVNPNAAGRIDLSLSLSRLYELNINTLMVEGGAQVITSFLAAGLVNLLVVTIAPRWIGGLPALDGGRLRLPELRDVVWEEYPPDAVLWARPTFSPA